MSQNHAYVAIPGTERTAPTELMPHAQAVSPAEPNERIQVTVVLRPEHAEQDEHAAQNRATRESGQRAYLSREELAAARGADPAAIAKIEAFAHQHGLAVVEANPAKRTVILSGTVAALSNAFKVQLTHYTSNEGRFRARSGPVMAPADLAPLIQTVVGLDNRPQLHPRFRALEPHPGHGVAPHAAGTSYTPVEIAQLYDFPAGLDGSGQSIGILEFGGGFKSSDIQTYFTQLSLPVPNVTAVSVDGATNQPTGDPTSADGEVVLDIEVCGAIAPKAHIVVYFAPNSDQGFINAINTAIHDTTNHPSVLSISWGAPEAQWTPATMQAIDQAFQDAALVGVTVFCASGDNGSKDGMPTGRHVDFPASSPNATGCGGTTLESAGGTITREVVWHDAGGGATGGGISAQFPLPSWQAQVKRLRRTRRGRGVPDVSGDASPTTGYQVLVDGQQLVFGGTSAVAPLWAGLITLINQGKQAGQQPPVGFLNPLIYGLPVNSGAFRDITSGTNGAYRAGLGWDSCTGWGSPDGSELGGALGMGGT